MKLFLDAGHGLGNRKPGIFDPGAEGNGTTEHAEVEQLRTDVIARIGNRIAVVPVPNDGFSLSDKGQFLVDRFETGDVFLSLHMNSSNPTGTGAEVLFDDAKPQHRGEAVAISASYAAGTGLRDRGAKPDTESHEGNVFLLGRFPGAGFLLETGFITKLSDLEIVRTKAAAVIADILITRFGTAPEDAIAAARARMTELGVFDDSVRRGQPLTTDDLAVYLARFEHALKR